MISFIKHHLSRVVLLVLLTSVSVGVSFPQSPPIISLYITGAKPIEPTRQSTQLRYLADYPLIDLVWLDSRQQDSILSLLQTPNLFNTEQMKSCPFEAAWAIEVIEEGKPSQQILLSRSPCSKAFVITPESQHWAVVPPENALEITLVSWTH